MSPAERNHRSSAMPASEALMAPSGQTTSAEPSQNGSLPARSGPRPHTQTAAGQSQLDQNGIAQFGHDLLVGMSKLDGVHLGPSGIAGPSAQAGLLSPETAHGPAEAFIVGTEFGHVHSDGTGSLHVVLPTNRARQAVEAGWGEWHPTVAAGDRPPNLVFLYGARTDAEADVLWRLVQDSYRFARGADPSPDAKASRL